MAVNRFTSAPAPMQHTGKFFQLPVEQLSQAIINQDTQYKQMQDSFDTFMGELNKQEYRPEDEAIAIKKNQQLLDEEKQLRDKVGGDILNPLYVDGLRNKLRKVALDPFRKKAKFNAKMFWDVVVPTTQDYAKQTGQALEGWQYPTLDFFNSYQDAETSGLAPYSTPEGILSFGADAETYLQQSLKEKRSTKKLYTKTYMSNGVQVTGIFSSETGELANDEIKQMIMNSELIGWPSYIQLQKRFKYDKAQQAKYGNFENYFDSVVNQIAENLAYKWSTEDLEGWVPMPGGGSDSSSGPKYSQNSRYAAANAPKEPTVNKGPGQEAMTAAPAVGYENIQQHMAAKREANAMVDEIFDGYVDVDPLTGESRVMPGATDVLYADLGIQKGNPDGIELKMLPGVNGELNIDMTVINPNTNKPETFNVLVDGFKYRNYIPEALQANYSKFLMRAHAINSDYAKWTGDVKQYRDFERLVASRNFGFDRKEVAAAFDQQGFYGLLTADKKKAVDNQGGTFIAGKLMKGEKLTERDLQKAFSTGVTGSPIGVVLEDQAANFRKLLQSYGVDLASVGLDEDFTDTRSFGKAAQALNTVASKLAMPKLYESFRTIRDEESIIYGANNGTKAEKAPFKDTIKTFQDKWEYGLNANLERISSTKNKSGTRQQAKVIRHFNLANNTGDYSTKLFGENLEYLIRGLTEVSKTGAGWSGANASAGAIQMHWLDTNKELEEKDYNNIKTKIVENKENFQLLGYTLDHEGFNIVATVKGLAGGTQNVEIRGNDQLIDMLVDAGMGDKLILSTAQHLVQSFQDTVGPESDEYSTLEKGQYASKPSAMIGEEIGMGIYRRPVRKLLTTMKGDDGKVYDEGTFVYHSLSKNETIYSADPIKIAMAYHEDRFELMRDSGLQLINQNDFPNGKLTIKKEVLDQGANMVNGNIRAILEDLVANPEIDHVHVTSMYRSPDDPKSKKYPSSKHIIGDGVDIRIREGGNGQIDLDYLDQLYNYYLDNRAWGVHFQLEYTEDITSPEYKMLYERYNKPGINFVVTAGEEGTKVPHATGTHVHIQVDQGLINAIQSGAIEVKK